jgi:hypothetical protein
MKSSSQLADFGSFTHCHLEFPQLRSPGTNSVVSFAFCEDLSPSLTEMD